MTFWGFDPPTLCSGVLSFTLYATGALYFITSILEVIPQQFLNDEKEMLLPGFDPPTFGSTNFFSNLCAMEACEKLMTNTWSVPRWSGLVQLLIKSPCRARDSFAYCCYAIDPSFLMRYLSLIVVFIITMIPALSPVNPSIILYDTLRSCFYSIIVVVCYIMVIWCTVLLLYSEENIALWICPDLPSNSSLVEQETP